MKRFFVAILIIFLSSCSGDGIWGGSDVVCTTEFVYGIKIDLYDSLTQQRISVCDTSYSIIDGAYTETGDFTGDPSCDTSYSVLAAGERSGTYSVEVSKLGYETWRSVMCCRRCRSVSR